MEENGLKIFFLSCAYLMDILKNVSGCRYYIPCVIIEYSKGFILVHARYTEVGYQESGWVGQNGPKFSKNYT